MFIKADITLISRPTQGDAVFSGYGDNDQPFYFIGTDDAGQDILLCNKGCNILSGQSLFI